jgi:hypothetical protein
MMEYFPCKHLSPLRPIGGQAHSCLLISAMRSENRTELTYEDIQTKRQMTNWKNTLAIYLMVKDILTL